MSAFGCIADVNHWASECPLIAKSGHSPTDTGVRLHHRIRCLTRGMNKRPSITAFLCELMIFCAIYRDDLKPIFGQIVGI